VFTPKHPRTRPTLELIEKAEGAVEIDTTGMTVDEAAEAVLKIVYEKTGEK
jgi:cytidylate kinase